MSNVDENETGSASNSADNHTGIDRYKQQRDDIEEIFTHIHKTIQKYEGLVSDACNVHKGCNKEDLQSVKDMSQDCSTMLTMIGRKKLKIVFFGSTSSGKSTTLNALLRANLLPQGMRHVTNCFIKVEGTREKCEYWKRSGETEKNTDMKKMRDSASAKRNKKVADTVIETFYPVESCDLLKHDIEFLDCPGFGFLEDVDKMIQKNCLDGDAFIFVTSAVGEIFAEELKFFEKVGKQLPKPNVFVLFNKWDESQKDEEHRKNAQEDREEHYNRASQWIEGLQLQGQEDAETEKRIYFVSSFEALKKRLQEIRPCEILKKDISRFHPKHEERFEEFQRFENNLWETTLESRFSRYLSKAYEMLGTLQKIIDYTRKSLLDRRKDLQEAEKEVPDFEKDFKGKMDEIWAILKTDEVEKHVQEFQDRFQEGEVDDYLQKLHQRVHEKIGKKIGKSWKNNIEKLFQVKKQALKVFSKDLATKFKSPKLERGGTKEFNKNVKYQNYIGVISVLKRKFRKDERQSTSTTPRAVARATIETATVVGGIGAGIAFLPAGLAVAAVGVCAYGVHYIFDRNQWSMADKEKFLKRNYLHFIMKQINKEKKEEKNKAVQRVKDVCREMEEDIKKRISKIEEVVGRFECQNPELHQHYNELAKFKSSYLTAST